MAQFPFAEQVRQQMVDSGFVFNPDGTTGLNNKADDVNKDPQDSSSPKTEAPKTENPVEPQQPAVGANQTSTDAPTTEASEKPATNWEEIARMQREELDEMRKKLDTTQSTKSDRELQLEADIEAMKAQMSGMTKQQQVDEIRELLERNNFNSELMDDETLLEIKKQLLAPVVGPLADRLAALEQRYREPTPQEKVAKIKKETQARIIKDIPDFQTIFNSKSFQNKLSQTDPRYPYAPYGEVLQTAYERGNSDFIIQEINHFLGNGKAPDVKDIADVGASNGVGTKPSTEQPKTGQYTFSDEEARSMLRKAQMQDISRQEYSQYRAKLTAHRNSLQQ